MNEAYETSIPGFQSGGLSADDRRDLFNNFARDLSPEQLQRVHNALGENDRQAELANAIDTHAPASVQAQFLDRTATASVVENIDGGLNNAEINDIRATLERLSPEQANRLFQSLSDDQLQTIASEIHDNGIFSNDGLNETERRDLFDTMSSKLDGGQLARFSNALGANRSVELTEQVAITAPVSTRQAFVKEALDYNAPGSQTDFNFGSYTTHLANSQHRNAATVAASLRADNATQLFASLSIEGRQSLFTAAANVSATTINSGHYIGGSLASEPLTDIDTQSFNALVDAATSVRDPALRAELAGQAIGTLHTLNQTQQLPARQQRDIANHLVDSIEGATIRQLTPDANAALAGALTAGGDISVDAVQRISGLGPSESRDTLIRTIFSKVPGSAYSDNSNLAPVMANAMVATTGSNLSIGQQSDAIEALDTQLQSDSGRALLANQNVHPSARLWAAEQVMAQPTTIDAAIGGSDKPWETPALLEMYGQARMNQFALAQTDQAVPVSGSNIENLIGTSVNATVREDVPADLESIADQIDRGEYNFFEGNTAVSKVADGVRAAQAELGGGAISIATVPIQFSSEQSGPIDLTVYRVESADGSRIVDTEGRTYDDVQHWVTDNALPPGQVTYPTDLQLGDGSTPVALQTSVTGSGGLATPVVAGAWAVAGGAAVWTTGRGIETLVDRAEHNQTLALTDSDARAAWLSVAAGGLTLGGGALMGTAARAANGSQVAVHSARAAGILNTGATYVDAATAANDVHTLYSQWDNMTPGQRAQTALSVAFWGGMTGVSARMGNGGMGDLSFSDNINRAMIETGARVTPDPSLQPGTARVVRGDGNQLFVEHHPDTPTYVVRAHQDAAHSLLSNGNTGAALQRFFGASDAYPPRSFGESTAVEIAKHESLIESLQTQLDSGNLAPAQANDARQIMAEYQFELRNFQADLAHIQANPEAGFAAGPDSIDVKRSNAFRVGADQDGLTLTAQAQLPFDTIASSSLQDQFPNATRVQLDDLNTDLSLTLSDGTNITKTGEHGNRLAQILRPVEQGGWGGAVFHDTATDTLIVSVNMQRTGSEGTLDRVEVSFARNDQGEWRVDFGDNVAYANQIDPDLARNRKLHFKEANLLLSAELATNPTLEAQLNLGTVERALVDNGQRVSPAPYTWHHVNGGGDMQLVNEAIHSFFNHAGGFSEWP